jgi:primosomal protein N' (replication factor Y)
MPYINVILPIPIKKAFTYEVNQDELRFVQPGMRVAVPFGRSKLYTALVYEVGVAAPQGYTTKSIDHILDETPLVTVEQFKLWEWMASYYLCSLGEVMRAALPAAYILESETVISLLPDSAIDESVLTDDEFVLWEALGQQTEINLNDLMGLLERASILPLVKRFVEKGWVQVREEVVQRYKPRMRRMVDLAGEYASEGSLTALLDELNRAPKQRHALMNLFVLKSKHGQKPVSLEELRSESGASLAVIKSLEEKGVVVISQQQVDRYQFEGITGNELPVLSLVQSTALEEIEKGIYSNMPVLLHGVTGSGKTAVYLHMIRRALLEGKTVLYLVPEIALTSQLIGRLTVFFGKELSVYHSRQNTNERVEVWEQVLGKKQKARLIIGARSALFLPFRELGLVIIDEEHEPSYKQFNPSPRYHARDSALVLARKFGAGVVMGSATPSLESYANVQWGKYQLVEIAERYGQVRMPEIELIDIREKYRKKLMTGHFSDRLENAMREVLADGKQVILFQNRRGYAPVLECTTCGVSPQCPNCDVSLTYHQYKNQLRCHYCGYHIPRPESCPACGSPTLDEKGLGTQQVESELKDIFPDHSVARMDQDTTRGKHGHTRLIEDFEVGKIDILVGTQMLAKGLDFEGVGLVGVMNADNLLNFPDFRAHERSFQLLLQVAGRAGRRNSRGLVLIQSFNPMHTILQQLSVYDYRSMYEQEMEERRQFRYAPWYRLIRLNFRHRDLRTVKAGADWFARSLRQHELLQVLGPEQPPVGRIRNQYITQVMVKIDRNSQLSLAKQIVSRIERRFFALKEFARIRVVIDVDPF